MPESKKRKKKNAMPARATQAKKAESGERIGTTFLYQLDGPPTPAQMAKVQRLLDETGGEALIHYRETVLDEIANPRELSDDVSTNPAFAGDWPEEPVQTLVPTPSRFTAEATRYFRESSDPDYVFGLERFDISTIYQLEGFGS